MYSARAVRLPCLGRCASTLSACRRASWNAASLPACSLRRYFGSHSTGALAHFFTVLRDRPVRLAMSLREISSRKCIRLTLPIMSMVITLFALLKVSAAQLSSLVNFESAAPRLHGQFSAGANSRDVPRRCRRRAISLAVPARRPSRQEIVEGLHPERRPRVRAPVGAPHSLSHSNEGRRAGVRMRSLPCGTPNVPPSTPVDQTRIDHGPARRIRRAAAVIAALSSHRRRCRASLH